MATTHALRTDTTTTAEPSRALHYSLWGVQVLLGVLFLGAGIAKATTPIPELLLKMPWIESVGAATTRFIGVSEFLGGVGLILPSLTRIKPQLTALAGAALATVMVLAAGLHLTRGEYGAIGINAVIGGLAAFVAWGRYKKAPIAPRA